MTTPNDAFPFLLNPNLPYCNPFYFNQRKGKDSSPLDVNRATLPSPIVLQMVLDVLIEFTLSAAIALGVAYFIFLNSPPSRAETRGGKSTKTGRSGDKNAIDAPSGSADDMYDDETARHMDSTKWLNVMTRWCACLWLGGGTYDGSSWTDRLAYYLDRSLQAVARGMREQHHLLPNCPILRVEKLTFGPLLCPATLTLQGTRDSGDAVDDSNDHILKIMRSSHHNHAHLRSTSNGASGGGGGGVAAQVAQAQVNANGVIEGGDVDAAPHSVSPMMTTAPACPLQQQQLASGVATLNNGFTVGGMAMGASLPIVEAIVSSESSLDETPSNGQVLREFEFSLAYADSSFHLKMFCEIPLLLGLPPQLNIPADLLTMRCRLDIQKLSFRTKLCVRMRGKRLEMFFNKMPHFEAEMGVFAVGNRRAHVNHHAAMGVPSNSTESKGGELVFLAVEREMQKIVFPRVLVLDICCQKPHFRWSRETLESTSV